jgi:uncharacterized alkaline shock family protein YloU
MATEYIVSKNHSNGLGVIGLSTSVFASIAALCLDDLPYARVASTPSFQKKVTCKVVDGTIVITMNVELSTDSNIHEATAEIKKRVHDGIVQLTSFKKVSVNVNIVGFYFN